MGGNQKALESRRLFYTFQPRSRCSCNESLRGEICLMSGYKEEIFIWVNG